MIRSDSRSEDPDFALEFFDEFHGTGFRIAVAETFDVIVEPSTGEAFTIFAQAMDRTGYAAGTLSMRIR